MRNSSIDRAFAPVLSIGGFEDALTGLLRERARKMLETAIEGEVAEYIHANREYLDKEGSSLCGRNVIYPKSVSCTFGPMEFIRGFVWKSHQASSCLPHVQFEYVDP